MLFFADFVEKGGKKLLNSIGNVTNSFVTSGLSVTKWVILLQSVEPRSNFLAFGNGRRSGAEKRGCDYRVKKTRIQVQL